MFKIGDEVVCTDEPLHQFERQILDRLIERLGPGPYIVAFTEPHADGAQGIKIALKEDPPKDTPIEELRFYTEMMIHSRFFKKL